ncbi:unnamed protein product, partial [Mesorhabditis belari]|uniref:DM domain-containing protein n=1 Tax=Mesorhabditis belari TaxID=2138241 RepID=A0AAF3FCL6_9BILA
MLVDPMFQIFNDCDFGKIGKDVARHCLMCRQHGIIVKTKGHTCPRKDCHCDRCEAIRNRRQIMSMQIKLRRHQDKLYRANTVLVGANQQEKQQVPYGFVYTCQRCKNHGLIRMRKRHSRECLYANCVCEMCVLVRQSTKIDDVFRPKKTLITQKSDPGPLVSSAFAPVAKRMVSLDDEMKPSLPSFPSHPSSSAVSAQFPFVFQSFSPLILKESERIEFSSLAAKLFEKNLSTMNTVELLEKSPSPIEASTSASHSVSSLLCIPPFPLMHLSSSDHRSPLSPLSSTHSPHSSPSPISSPSFPSYHSTIPSLIPPITPNSGLQMLQIEPSLLSQLNISTMPTLASILQNTLQTV